MDYLKETEARTEYIRRILSGAGAAAIVFGNSGGKDSALTGILCKMACKNTLGVMMPCHTRVNYTTDLADARLLAERYGIECVTVDLTGTRTCILNALHTAAAAEISETATFNVAPRLRMAALYAIAQTRGALVAGTGNQSENAMGYFTKWGDGAFDFNPIGDLTVTEIYGFLRYLGAPESIIEKTPSGGLADGQTDEDELGVSYAEIDRFLRTGGCEAEAEAIIRRTQRTTAHKRRLPPVYPHF